MSFWTALSGSARRAVAPGGVATSSSSPSSSSSSTRRVVLIAVDARRSITQSRPLKRGEDWRRPTSSSSSSSSSSSKKRDGSQKKTSGSFSKSPADRPILDFSTKRTPSSLYARDNRFSSTSYNSNGYSNNNNTKYNSSKRWSGGIIGASDTAATTAATAAATASQLYRRQGTMDPRAGRGKKNKDDSSDDEDDQEWLDRKRRPNDGMWPRGGVVAVDDADDDGDRSTLPRGQRSYDSEHEDEDDEDEDEDEDGMRENNWEEDYDEDPEYDRRYAHKKTSRITGAKASGAQYLYHPNVVLPALLKGYRRIHKLYIMNTYNRVRHPEIKQCVEAAAKLGIHPIKVDRHTLNMMAENRPHAGVVLEAGSIPCIPVTSLGEVSPEGQYTIQVKANELRRVAKQSSQESGTLSAEWITDTFQQPGPGQPPVWVVMDEVVDPQNMGAILRSAFFLGADGVVVCAKNSAPLSPVVAKASSGALEARRTFVVSSLLKFLQKSRENGWQVVGAHVTYGNKRTVVWHDWPATGVDRPTILVVGNEGNGLRKMVLRQCDHFVQIPALSPMDGVVDSLNVGTATGIILARFLGARFANLPAKLKKYRFRNAQHGAVAAMDSKAGGGGDDEDDEDEDENNDFADSDNNDFDGKETTALDADKLESPQGNKTPTS